MEGAPSSGSLEFDYWRLAMSGNPGLRREMEDALLLNLLRVNPSESGSRFVTGGVAEWILAATAYAAGVPLIPQGHSASGYDLRDVLAGAKALWSVKSQSTQSPGEFRLTNGLGGAGAGFVHPTIFLSPNLPGLVYVNPDVHSDVAQSQQGRSDATTMSHAVVKRHAETHPECVIEAAIPVNPRVSAEDPFVGMARDIVGGGRFPMLARLFEDVAPPSNDVLSQVRGLVAMRDSGEISAQDYDHLIRQVGLPGGQ